MKALAVILMLAVAAPAAVAPAETGTEKKERMICKRDFKSASRMNGPRTCRTAAQWKELKSGSSAQEDADQLEMLNEKATNGIGEVKLAPPQ